MARFLGGRVELIRADITTLEVDAIVNAANTSDALATAIVTEALDDYFGVSS